MNNRDNLIESLGESLTPTPRAGKIRLPAGLWFLAAVAITGIILALTGPFRAGALESLATHPHFLLESLAGVVAIVVLTATAFRCAIPSPGGPARYLWPALGLTALWLASYVVGLWHPALEPSMAGKREHCLYETFLFALPALAIGMFALRRLWPLHGASTGLLLGLATGLMPALAMQFACMYLQPHILTNHIAPGLAVGLVGAVCGHFLLRR